MATHELTTLRHAQHLQEHWLSQETIAVEQIYLESLSGPHKGLRFPLEKEHTLIGRGAWCDICLEHDPRTSKEHAELQLTAKGLLLRDLDSRNGTLLQQNRVVSLYLARNAEFQVGDSSFAVRTEGSPRELRLQFLDESQQLVGRSPQMRKIFSQLGRIGKLDLSVLIHGETGTGKTCIAHALHRYSPRRDEPFVSVNCGALAQNLVESSFFGHEKGAFTGASSEHKGYFEQADGGTLFLDEIGELPLELQPKLLDVVERGVIQRLGGERERQVDVRLLAATHRNLHHEVAQGRFRQDLFYRIAVIELTVPPLRERSEDIPLLVDWLLLQMELPQRVYFTPAGLLKLQEYLWPGNVRQLRNILQRSVALLELESGEVESLYLDADDILLPALSAAPAPLPSAQPATPEPRWPQCTNLKAFLEQKEREALLGALHAHDWNIARAAKSLDITRAWLYKRISRYKLRDAE